VVEGIQKLDRTTMPTVKSMIDNKVLIDYATYAKLRGKIEMGGEG